jgi:hypothetical protein
MDKITFTKSAAPAWLLAMWKEIDDKTFGKGFDCFAENAVCTSDVRFDPESDQDRAATHVAKGQQQTHDEMLEKARHADAACHLHDLVNSPALRPPK